MSDVITKRPASSAQNDLFNEEASLLLPARLVVDGKVLGSAVRQLAAPALRETCRLRPFSIRRVNGYEATLNSGEDGSRSSAPGRPRGAGRIRALQDRRGA
jgi:hypothetical protein